MPTFSWNREHCEAHLRTPEPQGLRTLALDRKLDKAGRYRYTSDILQFQFQTTAIKLVQADLRDTVGSVSGHHVKVNVAIKQVKIFLSVNDLVLSLQKTQHLCSRIKQGMPIDDETWILRETRVFLSPGLPFFPSPCKGNLQPMVVNQWGQRARSASTGSFKAI